MMYDFAIIGGGILGLSTGLALSQDCPDASILVLEKEGSWGYHQTGHNSGVIHAGIYYRSDSMKAKFTREGNRSIVEFCKEQGIKYEICGKIIVATERGEIPVLDDLYQRALANGLKATRIGSQEIKEIEPHVNGLAAIRIPSTGIVNFKQIAETFAGIIKDKGGDLRLETKVEKIAQDKGSVVIETIEATFYARFLINCAGLHSDRIAKLMNIKTGMKIVPFRGEYYKLKPQKRFLVKHLVYPVPNPNFPFLGVHFTRMIDGEIHVGPNAVLSFKREGYKKTDFDLKDFIEVMTYPAFWKLASKNWKEGTKEIIRSFSKTTFVRSSQKLIPEIQANDVVPTHAGVRAQALLTNSKLMDDFLLIVDNNSLHVCNAPSPAATASIEIGKAVLERIPEQFKLSQKTSR